MEDRSSKERRRGLTKTKSHLSPLYNLLSSRKFLLLKKKKSLKKEKAIEPTGEAFRPPTTIPGGGAESGVRPKPTSDLPPRYAPAGLYKQKSWSPDTAREEAWERRSKKGRRRRRSVTAEDLEELKACMELGFGFDSPELDTRLSDTLPALGLYHAVNKSYSVSISAKSTASFSSPDRDSINSPSPLGSPLAILGSSGENAQAVKTKLRQWAQVVACSVRNSST